MTPTHHQPASSPFPGTEHFSAPKNFDPNILPYSDWPYGSTYSFTPVDQELLNTAERLRGFLNHTYSEKGVALNTDRVSVYQINVPESDGRRIVRGWACPLMRTVVLSEETVTALLKNPVDAPQRIHAESVFVHELAHVYGYVGKERHYDGREVLVEGLNRGIVDPTKHFLPIGSITAEEYVVTRLAAQYVCSRGGESQCWENLRTFRIELTDPVMLEVIRLIEAIVPPEKFELCSVESGNLATIKIGLLGSGVGFPATGEINLGRAAEVFQVWEFFGHCAGGRNESAFGRFESALLTAQTTGDRSKLNYLIKKNLGEDACSFIDLAPWPSSSAKGVIRFALNLAYGFATAQNDAQRRAHYFKNINQAARALEGAVD